LYRQQGVAARALVTAQWRALERSLLLRAQVLRIEALQLRARCALAAAAETGVVATLLDAERDARRILREKMAWGEPLASLILAGVAAARSRRDEAITLLASAEAGCEIADMPLYEQAARYRRGQLLGGAAGDALVASAQATLCEQNIKNPAAVVAMLAP